jgi:hypothetical protein
MATEEKNSEHFTCQTDTPKVIENCFSENAHKLNNNALDTRTMKSTTSGM